MSLPGSEAILRADEIRETVEAVYRTESRRVLATLIRLLGSFDLAEEALHDAFIAIAGEATAREMGHVGHSEEAA